MRYLQAAMATVAITFSNVAASVDMPVVYNHVSGSADPLDREVHDRLGKRYRVVDFTDREHTWVFPKSIAGFTPNAPVYVDDRCVAGSVLVVFVISREGAVVDAFSVKSTSGLLAELGVKSMSAKRFAPGKLDGRPVASVAASNVHFRCPAEGK